MPDRVPCPRRAVPTALEPMGEGDGLLRIVWTAVRAGIRDVVR